MERGYKPEDILSLGRDERLIYIAIAELNEQKKQENLETAILNAMIRFNNMMN